MKKNYLIINYLIMGLIFTSIALGIIIVTTIKGNIYQSIIKQGEITVATVIGFDSNFISNDVEYYHLKVEYYDQDKNIISATTPSIYRYQEALNIFNQGEIEVYQNGTNRVVPLDYQKIPGSNFIILFGFIFLIPGSIFLISFFISIRGRRIENKIYLHGTEGVGHIIDYKGGLRINSLEYFKIKFNFKNDNYQIITVKTGYRYKYYELEYLRSLPFIKIKYLNNKAVILEEQSGIGNYENNDQEYNDQEYK